MRDPDFTLSAGPVMASPRVLAALGSPITYHYDPAFLEAFRRSERKLAEIFLTKSDVLLMQGEAVLGLEAAARALVQPGTPALNLVQGIFGKGMGYWLKDFGAELHELEVPYNDAVDPALGTMLCASGALSGEVCNARVDQVNVFLGGTGPGFWAAQVDGNGLAGQGDSGGPARG